MFASCSCISVRARSYVLGLQFGSVGFSCQAINNARAWLDLDPQIDFHGARSFTLTFLVLPHRVNPSLATKRWVVYSSICILLHWGSVSPPTPLSQHTFIGEYFADWLSPHARVPNDLLMAKSHRCISRVPYWTPQQSLFLKYAFPWASANNSLLVSLLPSWPPSSTFFEVLLLTPWMSVSWHRPCSHFPDSYTILPTIKVPCVWTVSIIDRSFLILYISVVEWTPPCGVLWAPKSHGIQKGTRDHGYFPIFSPPPVSIVTTQARHLEVILPLSPCSSSVTTFCLYNS